MGKTFRRNAKHTPVEHRRRKVKEELPDATPLVESLSESFQVGTTTNYAEECKNLAG